MLKIVHSLSFFKKMILYGCLVSMVPVIVLGFFSYMKSSNMIQDYVQKDKVQTIQQVRSNLEQTLQTVEYTLNHISDSTLINQALQEPLNEYQFRLYRDLRKELAHLQSFDTRVSDVTMVNARRDWVLQNEGVSRLGEFPGREALISYLDKPYPSAWIVKASRENATHSCDYTVSLVKKLPVRGNDKYGLFLVDIPTCELKEMLSAQNDFEKVIILDQDYRVILHEDESLVGTSFRGKEYVKNLEMEEEKESGQFQVNIEEKPFTVTFQRSPFNDWIYISLVSIDELTADSKQIGLFSFTLCVVIGGSSFLVIWFGSRRMYRPIQKLMHTIQERIPQTKETKQNEFQLINEQMSNLFLSQSQLEQKVQKHLPQLQSFFMSKLLQGKVKSDEIAEKLSTLGFSQYTAQWKHHSVISLQLDSGDHERFSDRDLALLLFAAGNVVEETVPRENRLVPVIDDQTLALVIGSDVPLAERFEDDIYKMCEAIQGNIGKSLNLKASIGISQPFKQWINVDTAYRESVESLKWRVQADECVIIHYHPEHHDKKVVQHIYPAHLAQDLLEAVSNTDEERAEELLKQLLLKLTAEEPSFQDYQMALVRLLHEFVMGMQDMGISHYQINGEPASLYEQLVALHKPREIESWFLKGIVRPLIRILRDRRESQYQNLSDAMIDIVHRNYDQDLTLEQCADKLHYNANYLSSVFKKETGLTFREYLAQYRLQTAKKWLTETSMTIKEIAEKLRYNNPQNFIRSFRKNEGMTPGQYRMRYGKKLG